VTHRALSGPNGSGGFGETVEYRTNRHTFDAVCNGDVAGMRAALTDDADQHITRICRKMSVRMIHA
jgi:hypothetical protein